MARKNPSLDKSNKMLPGVLDGIDPLPNPIGVNHDALYEANEMPGHGALGVKVDMTPNDGDQKDVPSPAFATGSDIRHFEGGPSGSDPYPAKDF